MNLDLGPNNPLVLRVDNNLAVALNNMGFKRTKDQDRRIYVIRAQVTV